ncbi:hypothetical protein GF325_07220 [Candidatus Bathyarchaeota archaeon]|nr:hypothetical protein [Candidatus Bathyarchaeota archaeon]
MGIATSLREARNRLRDWWSDPSALGRPVVLCNCVKGGNSRGKHWEYFTYPNMIIKMLGNDKLKPQLRAAQDAPYHDIPELPKAPTGIKLDFDEPANAALLAKVKHQVDASNASSPHADAIPILRSQAGPGFPACCLGECSCIPTTGPGTIWYETVRPWKELEYIELDRTSPWWQFMVAITRKQLENSPKHLAVGFPSMQGTTDILQTLRGTQNLLRDMIKAKDRVTRALDKISVAFQETVSRFWDLIRAKREGSGSFIGIWAPGNAPSIQCDALAYLGPRQFKQFALPYIIRDLENADFGTYHLDGPGAIKFLHGLLEIPNLDLIQWVEGYGNPDGVALRWYPLVRKVLEAGKRIILYTSIDRIPHFMRRLNQDGVDPRGVVFNIGNIVDFEIDEFLPWLEANPETWKAGKWYDDDYWQEYAEILENEPERYRDLDACSIDIDLQYD